MSRKPPDVYSPFRCGHGALLLTLRLTRLEEVLLRRRRAHPSYASDGC